MWKLNLERAIAAQKTNALQELQRKNVYKVHQFFWFGLLGCFIVIMFVLFISSEENKSKLLETALLLNFMKSICNLYCFSALLFKLLKKYWKYFYKAKKNIKFPRIKTNKPNRGRL